MIGLDDLMTQARPIVEEIEFRKSAKPARREDDFMEMLADMIEDRAALIAGESQEDHDFVNGLGSALLFKFPSWGPDRVRSTLMEAAEIADRRG